MYDALAPELLHGAAVLLLAVAAEDGQVDPREVTLAGELLAGWGRTDRVSAAQQVQAAFQELGQVWQMGGHAELERHLWAHAGVLVGALDWHALHALVGLLHQVADADGTVHRSELGIIEALASYFDREAGPPADMTAVDLLAGFDEESRGPRWVERFQAAIARTPLEIGPPGVPAAADPRLFDGPGGIALAEARLQPTGGFTVDFAELVRWCTQRGVGVMVEPEWTDPPGWVLRYGELWSFRAFDGSFAGPGPAGPEMALDQLMPPWAREQLARLFERYGLPGRQVAHMISPAGEPALAFDAPAAYLPDPARHDDLERELRTMSPPGTVFLTVDPAQQPDFPFVPL